MSAGCLRKEIMTSSVGNNLLLQYGVVPNSSQYLL